MRVQEVVTNATAHVVAAEAKVQDAELRARASELQANEKVALMQRVMQESQMRAQADAQALALERHQAQVQLQQMMQESAQHESQLQALRAETDMKLRMAEQALSRQASTAAPSVGSAAEAGVDTASPLRLLIKRGSFWKVTRPKSPSMLRIILRTLLGKWPRGCENSARFLPERLGSAPAAGEFVCFGWHADSDSDSGRG